ncbi:hypothetical protein PR048_013252 [Dryococelus australis]|uniref:Uncharacterized protein n=1 Tax=Dryococelus australis TaxID=614101 RepID=A0ABQ9HRQ3_9NEOP|nr:hypothetical protein PR048_013252 [Dryococelus australis]
MAVEILTKCLSCPKHKFCLEGLYLVNKIKISWKKNVFVTDKEDVMMDCFISLHSDNFQDSTSKRHPVPLYNSVSSNECSSDEDTGLQNISWSLCEDFTPPQ